MTDQMLRAMSADGLYRVFAVRTTDTVSEAIVRHRLAGVPAMALARGLTAALLAGATDPEWHRMSFQWASRGPIGTMHVDARSPGDLRGYINLAEDAITALGRPLEAWVRPGILVALRQEPSARFSQGQIPIGTGAVDHDVEVYLESSEGVASGLRVLASEDAIGGPVDVVGVLVQTMPGGDPSRTALPADISDRIRSPEGSLEDLMAAALPDTTIQILESVPVRFTCQCSRSRVESSIRLLGASELETMIAGSEETSVRCEFCATTYDVGVTDLKKILAGLLDHPIGEA